MWSDRAPAAATARRARSLREWLPVRGTGSPVRRRLRIDIDAETLAQRLLRQGSIAWLDGGEEGEHQLAIAPLMSVRSTGTGSRLTAGTSRKRWRADGFDLLESILTAFAASAPDARLFGYLSYELAARLEELPAFPPADLPFADMEMGLHDLWIQGRAGDWALVGTDAWRGVAGTEEVAIAIERAAGLPGPDAPAVSIESQLLSQPSERGYQHAVARTVQRIFAGEIFETNLCRRLEFGLAAGDGWGIYRAMRGTGEAEHAAFIANPRLSVLSRSPEGFLSVRDGLVRSGPIKGTRPRDRDPQRDAALRQELLSSEKDRAELAMIVDLVRNDLGRVCAPGSVRVARHAALMELDTVWHTVSEVVGQLRQDCSSVDLLRASFPPGSITGAPKIAAIAAAAREEPCRRGPAMGSIGWIGLGGDLELSVAIRTAVAAAGRVVYHAGCGIVADSDPQSELEETRAKARVFLEALGR